MGKVLSLMKRPFRDFNLESRAHKIISQNKPIAAPRHKADSIQYEKILQDHPEILQESMKKHDKLDKHLKDVFVVSHNQETKKQEENPDRPLPLDRKALEDFEFGFKEPNKVPYGKATLRKVLQFISEHQTDPKTYNYKKIAEEHSLPEEKVQNILKYFRVYEVLFPEHKVKANFAGPSIPKTQVTKVRRPELMAGKSQKDET